MSIKKRMNMNIEKVQEYCLVTVCLSYLVFLLAINANIETPLAYMKTMILVQILFFSFFEDVYCSHICFRLFVFRYNGAKPSCSVVVRVTWKSPNVFKYQKSIRRGLLLFLEYLNAYLLHYTIVNITLYRQLYYMRSICHRGLKSSINIKWDINKIILKSLIEMKKKVCKFSNFKTSFNRLKIC